MTGTSPWLAKTVAATSAAAVQPAPSTKPGSFQVPVPGGVVDPLPPFDQTWMFPESVERSIVFPLEQLIFTDHAASMTQHWVFSSSTPMTLLVVVSKVLMSVALVVVIQLTGLEPWAKLKVPMVIPSMDKVPLSSALRQAVTPVGVQVP